MKKKRKKFYADEVRIGAVADYLLGEKYVVKWKVSHTTLLMWVRALQIAKEGER